jgi:hypothetical protein
MTAAVAAELPGFLVVALVLLVWVTWFIFSAPGKIRGLVIANLWS